VIDQSALPSYLHILERLGLPPGRHGRSSCPLCGGSKNSTKFSYSETKGLWHCFACGAKGDKISLVEKALNCDFKEALRWLGCDRSAPVIKPRLISEEQRKAEALERLEAWCSDRAGELAHVLRSKDDLIAVAKMLPHDTPEQEDELMQLLGEAYRDYSRLQWEFETLLSGPGRNVQTKLALWREWYLQHGDEPKDQPTEMSEQDKAAWREKVEAYYREHPESLGPVKEAAPHE